MKRNGMTLLSLLNEAKQVTKIKKYREKALNDMLGPFYHQQCIDQLIALQRLTWRESAPLRNQKIAHCIEVAVHNQNWSDRYFQYLNKRPLSYLEKSLPATLSLTLLNGLVTVIHDLVNDEKDIERALWEQFVFPAFKSKNVLLLEEYFGVVSDCYLMTLSQFIGLLLIVLESEDVIAINEKIKYISSYYALNVYSKSV